MVVLESNALARLRCTFRSSRTSGLTTQFLSHLLGAHWLLQLQLFTLSLKPCVARLLKLGTEKENHTRISNSRAVCAAMPRRTQQSSMSLTSSTKFFCVNHGTWLLRRQSSSRFTKFLMEGQEQGCCDDRGPTQSEYTLRSPPSVSFIAWPRVDSSSSICRTFLGRSFTDE